MASQVVRKVVGRLLRDDCFKKQFEANPEDSLETFQLTQEERDAQRNIDLGDISKTNLQISNESNTAIVNWPWP
jgi:hypothetical protein